MLISSRATSNYCVLKTSWHSSNCLANIVEDGSTHCKLQTILP